LSSLSRWFLLLTVLLVLFVAGCGERGTGAETPAPVADVSPEPSVAATATVLLARDTPTPVPPSATPITLPPTSAIAASPTVEVPTPAPTASLTPAPTASPTAVPAPTASGFPDPAAVEVELVPVVGGLDRPVGLANAGDGRGWLFVVEKVGRIRIVAGGDLIASPFLDISDRVGSSQNEQGLLGLAFHPDYANNGFFFVNYTDLQGDTAVSRFSVSADPARADPGSEAVLLRVEQPAGNHNGGHVAFGPDGYLYIGLGDGGGAGDRYGNGQNGQTLLGAMLRLDIDQGTPYAIPEDNPFVGNEQVRDEIWALGLRNPWRYSFDRLTGDLYIADVGQNTYEEVNLQRAGDTSGQNYGWPIMEGLHCFPADRPCEREGLTLPVWEYDHTQGCSVTGGYVYRGEDLSVLRGIYLFGDYCSGTIWGLAPARDGGDWRVARLTQTDLQLSTFGEDETGELYVLDMGRGELLKVTARSR
jgi:glucose/arabinose dehydrogenase